MQSIVAAYGAGIDPLVKLAMISRNLGNQGINSEN